MSEELKPCPFCGSDDLLEGPHSPYIICNGCGAFGPGNSDMTHEEAIKAWNTRTPEQAIATTFGRVGSEVGSKVGSKVRGGKLTAEQVRKVVDRNCEWYEGGEIDAQAIADELNATLGDGECTPHGEWEKLSQTQEVRHVFCECGYELGMDERDSFPFKCTRLFVMPNYCQECGRKIRKAVKR